MAEQFLNDPKGKEEISKDRTLRRLLLGRFLFYFNDLKGTVLLDTVGLDPKFGKTFPKDQAIVKALHELDQEIDVMKYFQAIQEAKFDTSSLRTAEHLIKDYKAWDADSGATYGNN